MGRSRKTKAVWHSSPVEKIALLAFIASSVWAGHALYQTWSRALPGLKTSSVHTRAIGTEWNQANDFGSLVSFEQLSQRQSQISSRLTNILNQTEIEMDYVTTVYPPTLHSLNKFSDYALKSLTPIPGFVYRISKDEAKCVQFSWTSIPLPKVQYFVEVAKKPDFVFFRSFGSATNALKLQMERGADLFWRVRAVYGREQTVGPISNMLVLEPALTSEEKRLRDLASQVRVQTAWLNDLNFCTTKRTPARSRK